MIRRPKMRRSGTTLVEVLVGFGILGIGVTSVITLFPFSALTLGQALRDDRTTTAAMMGDGEMRDVHLRYVVEVGDNSPELYHQAMDNPALITGSTLPPLSKTDPGPSYPVFADPMGVVAGRRPAVGDNGETGIPRVNFNFIATSVNPQALALHYCSLMDSLTFDDSGNVPGGFDMRELRYNYAWTLQRPVNRDRFNVRMQIVVFNKRAHLYAPPGSEAAYYPTTGYPGVLFTPGETAITNVPATADVRKGGWIMDGTIGTDPQGRPLRHAEWYRIVSVTDMGGSLALEVHKPVARADGLINPPNTSVYAYYGTLVSMPGVADVFDRPNLTGGTGP